MKVLREEVVYKGKFMDFVVMEYERDGKVFKRQLVRHPGAVVIVPILGDKVIFERQFRFSIGGYLLELPAGTLEKGEDPLECAKRELLEETGYIAEDWEKVAEFYLAPGYSTEYMHLFFARNLKFLGKNSDEDEEIETLVLSRIEIIKGIEEGRIRDAKSLLGSVLYLLRT
jgi:NTP pyrophosphohydrolases including oxidative damage repair enzymes